MRPIGGYFELELPHNPNCRIPVGGVNVNSGRHALEYILGTIGNKIKRVLLPYYTCDVVLEPIRRLNLAYDFYHINKNLEIDPLPELKDGDYIILNNYFGIKDAYIRKISKHYQGRCIIDNAQALYYPTALGENSFYSPRKFFGVPDGGVAWVSGRLDQELYQDVSFDRISHLAKRIDLGSQQGYDDFRLNSAKLKVEPLKSMSKLTDRILDSIDYEWAKIKRRSNFEQLHKKLAHLNGMMIPDMKSFACPMVYPFFTTDGTLRNRLIENNIFVATYWPNVLKWCDESNVEFQLAKYILPLPIDQRYGEKDMNIIIEIIAGY